MAQQSTAIERVLRQLDEENEKSRLEMAQKASYKIQFWFQSERSDRKPVTYSLSAWSSGKRLHGGGDESLFICRRHTDAPKPFDVVGGKSASPMGCGGFISGDYITPQGLAVCPHCHAQHKTEHIADAVLYRSSIADAASTLTSWWRRLNCDADIYLKYAPYDIRVKTMQNAFGLRKARELKGLTIYPLERILKDTAAGADVEARFRALLLA